MLKAVFFDFGNTLATFPDMETRTQELIAAIGEDRFHTVHKLYVESHRDRMLTAHEVLQRVKTTALFTEAEERLVGRWLGDVPLVVYSDVEPTLALLKTNQLQLGIISNCAPATGETLRTLPMARFFDAFVLSYEIGAAKPSAAIFEHALKLFGIKGKEALMIGDSVEKDVNGALGAGLKAVLLDRTDSVTYSPKIKTLHELWTFMLQFPV